MNVIMLAPPHCGKNTGSAPCSCSVHTHIGCGCEHITVCNGDIIITVS